MAYVRQSSVALWFGNLSGPIALIVNFQLRYALVPYACKTGQHWMLTAISIPLFVIALVGAFVSWRGLHADDGDVMRIRFMALGAVALGFAFSLAIIAGTLPDFFLRPCE